MKKHSKRLISTAYHEAGHAVAAHFLDRKFKSITIKPGEDYLGRVILHKSSIKDSDFYIDSPWVRKKIETEVMIDCAGYLAQKKFNSKTLRSSSSKDFRDASELLERICQGYEEEHAYLNYLMVRIKCYLQWDIEYSPYWTAVKKIAKKLLERETIYYKDAKEIIIEIFNKYFERKKKKIYGKLKEK